jgi:hypothetical protein
MSNVNYKSDWRFLYWDEPVFNNSNSTNNDSNTDENRD